MENMESVKIGPEFFKNAMRDYADTYWAFAREIMQNAMDSDGCDNIDVTISPFEGDTLVVVTDNGSGMDETTVREKLLTLGGSAKSFQNGKVGGFGKAKEILYFAQKSYRIDTRDLIINGCGAQYSLIKNSTFINGCSATIRWADDVDSKLTAAFELFCEYSQWAGTVTINGNKVLTNTHKGFSRREFSFGTIYTNKKFDHTAIVRMHGIPMFHSYISYRGTVILELSSSDVLTANRDGLTYDPRQTYSNFLTQITVDRRSALRNNDPKYIHYDGSKIVVLNKKDFEDFKSKVEVNEPDEPESIAAFTNVIYAEKSGNYNYNLASKTASEPQQNKTEIDFFLKNTTRLAIPTSFQPDSSKFNSYSMFVAKSWINVLIEMHRLVNVSKQFSVGFIMSEESEAEYEKKSDKEIYFINPTVITDGKRQRFSRRFKRSEKARIISIAAHEIVHGMGYTYHDEDYANKLTAVMNLVLENINNFKKCFKV